MMATIEIRMLGDFEIRVNGKPDGGRARRKRSKKQ